MEQTEPLCHPLQPHRQNSVPLLHHPIAHHIHRPLEHTEHHEHLQFPPRLRQHRAIREHIRA